MSQAPTKRKRGRPATGETPKQYFRMADSEYAIVEKAAEKRGETTSEFIRQTLLARAKSVLRSK